MAHIFIPFPLFSGTESPVNQADKPNRFLLPLPTSSKIPGNQGDYSLLYQHWTSQVPVLGMNPSLGSITAYGILELPMTSSTYKSWVRNLDSSCWWTVRPTTLVVRDAFITICYLWGLTHLFHIIFQSRLGWLLRYQTMYWVLTRSAEGSGDWK